MLMNGRRDLTEIGGYRTHADATEIVSDALQDPHVHFEAPPSDRVLCELAQFVAWFNDSFPQGTDLASGPTVAGRRGVGDSLTLS